MITLELSSYKDEIESTKGYTGEDKITRAYNNLEQLVSTEEFKAAVTRLNELGVGDDWSKLSGTLSKECFINLLNISIKDDMIIPEHLKIIIKYSYETIRKTYAQSINNEAIKEGLKHDLNNPYDPIFNDYKELLDETGMEDDFYGQLFGDSKDGKQSW